MNAPINVRNINTAMGQAVAERTIFRKKENGTLEKWGDVAKRVAIGNALLCPDESDVSGETYLLEKHIANASLLMSGRHLQHGDADQPNRNMEVFSNCSSSSTSFAQFYLLLNGSGVGRSYDDDFMVVDWDNAPNIRLVLDETHADYDMRSHESVRDAKHKYGGESKNVMWFEVPDSREGWAKALEMWELAAFEKIHRDKMLILDFSLVRPNGSPIGGMQNRPASGPIALMNAFTKSASLKGASLDPWKQAMYVDHYFAECVLVGGARRAARIATKYWKDSTILDFVEIKRPIEYNGRSVDEVIEYRDNAEYAPFGFLWSANNSVMVDKEFWSLLDIKRGSDGFNDSIAQHARKVWKRIVDCSYGDGTGEPALINVDKLASNDEGLTDMSRGDYIGYWKYQLQDETQIMMAKLAKKAKKMKYVMIVNPCGEEPLAVWGAYCTIADVVPFHSETLDDAEEAFRVATRAMIRVNLLPSLYQKEVNRTNRIGIGMTGVHEFAWKYFNIGFRDLINPDFDEFNDELQASFSVDGLMEHENARVRSASFWMTLNRFGRAVSNEAEKYSTQIGVTIPHTDTTMKPAGSTSKLFGLSEGCHLPAMAFYLRWVQFRHDDPLIEQYRAEGYPVKELTTYEGTTIIGFPTAPTIATLGMGDAMVTAAEATPEEQYKWLMLLEKFYLRGVDPVTMEALGVDLGGQLSYTLKYDPEIVDIKQFRDMMREYQPQIKACSVMPQADNSAYEYLPESAISKIEYEEILRAIKHELEEDVGLEHLDCAGGACPVSFDDGVKGAGVAA
jgi:adenosylcobalamin-dependent ribonucleoside-triphosphate reductase